MGLIELIRAELYQEWQDAPPGKWLEIRLKAELLETTAELIDRLGVKTNGDIE